MLFSFHLIFFGLPYDIKIFGNLNLEYIIIIYTTNKTNISLENLQLSGLFYSHKAFSVHQQ